MRRRFVSAVVALVPLACGPRPASAPAGDASSASSPARSIYGCYGNAGQVIGLDSARVTGAGPGARQALFVFGVTSETPVGPDVPSAYWRMRGDTVLVTNTNGLTGTGWVLIQRGDTLFGGSYSFGDIPVPGPPRMTPVRLVRIACPR